MRGGEVVEEGAFELDGVAFPAAEIRLEFLDPGGDEDDGDGDGGALFPTGRIVETLQVPGVGAVEATLITAGNPTIFVEASALGLGGTELPDAVNADAALLSRCEAVRACGAVAIATAAAIPGTVVYRVMRRETDPARVRFGHPSGTLAVGAEAGRCGDRWVVTKAVMSRSARRLMEGWVRVPARES